MAAGVPVDDALIAIGLGSAAPRRARRYPPFSGSPPPDNGVAAAPRGIFTRRTFSPLSYSQPIALSICEKRRQVAAVGHWASFSCRASNSEGEMQGSSWPSCSSDNKRFFPRGPGHSPRACCGTVRRVVDYRIDISGDQPARRRANGRG